MLVIQFDELEEKLILGQMIEISNFSSLKTKFTSGQRIKILDDTFFIPNYNFEAEILKIYYLPQNKKVYYLLESYLGIKIVASENALETLVITS